MNFDASKAMVDHARAKGVDATWRSPRLMSYRSRLTTTRRGRESKSARHGA